MHEYDPSDDFEESTDISPDFKRPSKSQLKREAHAIRDLGAELVKLSPAQLTKIPLPVEIRDAVVQAQSIKQHGARRRQLQYIGKRLRQIDCAAIAEALAALQAGTASEKREHHWLEQIREALIAGEDAALDAVFARYPQAERQYLRRLIEKARRERRQNRPPSASRELFRYLRDLGQAD